MRARARFLGSVAALFGAISSASAESVPKPGPELRAAITRALPLLKKGAEGHVAQRTCFACHHQFLPVLAFTTARQRGFRLPDEDLEKLLDPITAFLDRNRDNYRQGKGQGGQVDMAGYALLTLELGGRKANAITDAVVEYLLLRDKEHDHWRAVSQRPPSEASNFTSTYLAVRALRHWGKPAHKDKIAKRLEAVRGWLVKAPARDTEDRVFRTFALHSVQADKKQQLLAVQDLVRTQHQDGGWGQTDDLDSDAYATGSALVALHQADGLSVTDPVYQRGIAYLLKSQSPYGSWLVRSRSKPFQTYYESGFPHGKNQFISMAATGWATTALILACPVEEGCD